MSIFKTAADLQTIATAYDDKNNSIIDHIEHEQMKTILVDDDSISNVVKITKKCNDPIFTDQN